MCIDECLLLLREEKVGGKKRVTCKEANNRWTKKKNHLESHACVSGEKKSIVKLN